MATLLTNRVQSAHARSAYRPTIDNQDPRFKPRPTTSLGNSKSVIDLFDDADFKNLQPSSLSAPPPTRRQRAKTASIVSATGSIRSASARKLRSSEIESLLESLNRNDSYVVKVDCLADYRTLVQTLDLRRTPLDCHILCALQQRENQIIQQNALRDKRFRSLREVLEPLHERENLEENQSHNEHRTAVPDYAPSDLSYDYAK